MNSRSQREYLPPLPPVPDGPGRNRDPGRDRLPTRAGQVYRVLGPYAGALALCLLVLTWVLQLWRADLSLPLYYEGDSLLVQSWIKGGIDNRWYLHNHYLGMPTGLELYDWPTEVTASFVFLVLKLTSLAVPSSAVVLNLYYLASFPLITLTSLFVLRRFRLSALTATAVSLLFTYLPYHLGRNEAHLFLSGYYLVPPTVMVALWLYRDSAALFFPFDEATKETVFRWQRPRALAGLGVCALVGLGQVYYAFFGCYLVAVAGTAACLRRRNAYALGAAAILITTIGLGVGAGLIPSVLYCWKHGPNPETYPRHVGDVEVNGMKISQLLLPAQGHRLRFLRELRDRYDQVAPFRSENGLASLGIVGSLGFLILIGHLLQRRAGQARRLMDGLSLLNVFAVLLGTIGGFGAVFALVVTPRIRCYNRISIYIAFLALFAVGLLVDRMARARPGGLVRLALLPVVLGGLLVVGLLDQTSAYHTPAYATVAREYQNDAAFVATIEASVPQGAMIFQLPYVPFPENPPVQGMGAYDLLRGYLHSRTLRWSFGAMKGRPGDWCSRLLAVRPMEEMVKALSSLGFGGIYLDRNGFADGGAAVEAALSRILEVKALESPNRRLVFYDLAPFNRKLRSGESAARGKGEAAKASGETGMERNGE